MCWDEDRRIAREGERDFEEYVNNLVQEYENRQAEEHFIRQTGSANPGVKFSSREEYEDYVAQLEDEEC